MRKSLHIAVLTMLLVAAHILLPDLTRPAGAWPTVLDAVTVSAPDRTSGQAPMPDSGDPTGDSGDTVRENPPDTLSGVDSTSSPSDIDGDGVPDTADKCPDSPSKYAVDQHGCVDMARLFARRVLNISYSSGGSDLSMKEMSCLDSIAELLADFENVTVSIYGYTDNIGGENANLRLSRKRANKIRDYLVLRGINENRIKAVGKGETDFIAPNSDKYGREKNRRIEVQFDY